MFANINGTKIFFDVDGKRCYVDGKPENVKEKHPCFILHGGPGMDHMVYGDLCEPFTEYLQLIYVDWRGNGRSERCDPATYTIEQNVEDLEALRKYLGFEKIILFGQSYGGIMSQAYASKYPENVMGMILITTSPSFEMQGRAQDELDKRGTPEQKSFKKVGEKYTSNKQLFDFCMLFADLYSYTSESAELFREATKSSILNYEPINVFYTNPNFDFRESLKKVKCPTLVMGGKHDWITPISCTNEIIASMPHCESYIMEESSHNVFQDQPEE